MCDGETGTGWGGCEGVIDPPFCVRRGVGAWKAVSEVVGHVGVVSGLDQRFCILSAPGTDYGFGESEGGVWIGGLC